MPRINYTARLFAPSISSLVICTSTVYIKHIWLAPPDGELCTPEVMKTCLAIRAQTGRTIDQTSNQYWAMHSSTLGSRILDVEATERGSLSLYPHRVDHATEAPKELVA